MLETAPEKWVLTNHAPRLRLKVNSISGRALWDSGIAQWVEHYEIVG